MKSLGGAWRAICIGILEGRRSKLIRRLSAAERALRRLGWRPPSDDRWLVSTEREP